MVTPLQQSYPAAELNTQEEYLPTAFSQTLQRPRFQILTQALETNKMAQSEVHPHVARPVYNKMFSAEELDELMAPEENPFAAFAAVFSPRQSYRTRTSGSLPQWMQHVGGSVSSDKGRGSYAPDTSNNGTLDTYDSMTYVPFAGGNGYEDGLKVHKGVGKSVAWSEEEGALQTRGSFPHTSSTAATDLNMWGSNLSAGPGSLAEVSGVWNDVPASPKNSSMAADSWRAVGDVMGGSTRHSTDHRSGTSRFAGLPPSRGYSSLESARATGITSWRRSVERQSAGSVGSSALASSQTGSSIRADPDAIAAQLNSALSVPHTTKAHVGMPALVPRRPIFTHAAASTAPYPARSTSPHRHPSPVDTTASAQLPSWRSQAQSLTKTMENIDALDSPTAGWGSLAGDAGSTAVHKTGLRSVGVVPEATGLGGQAKPVGRWSKFASEAKARLTQTKSTTEDNSDSNGNPPAVKHRTLTIRRPKAKIEITMKHVISAVAVLVVNTGILISFALVLNNYLTG